jgi:hypothetical protein
VGDVIVAVEGVPVRRLSDHIDQLERASRVIRSCRAVLIFALQLRFVRRNEGANLGRHV